MAFYNLTSDAEFQGATVIFPDGTTLTIGADNPNFTKVRDGLLDGSLSDDELLNLIAPFEAIYKTLTKLSERIARKGSKLLFDGDVIKNALTDHIIKIMNEGGDEVAWKAYVAFMEKLYTNPSEASREHLFHFIEKHGLLVTPDGDAVFYKSTNTDGTSTYAGYGVVNGVEYENDRLPNSVGAVVEIPRSMVDDNRAEACSVGLHVGAHRYAKTYSQRMWTVIVNPRDVVSVPSDSNDEKIRVARYVVAEENPQKIKYDGTVKAFEIFTPEPEVQEAVAEAAAPETIKVAVTPRTAAPAAKPTDGSRKEEFKALITALLKTDPKVNLKRYKNKKITAGRRDEFEAAANELGHKL